MTSTTFLAATGRLADRLAAPRLFVPIVLAIYLAVNFAVLRNMTLHPDGRAQLVSGDAGHYVAIAGDFAAGNWTMDYVKKRPHRQPLYPALLAPAVKLSGGSYFAMGSVNVLLGGLGFLVAYFGVLRLPAHRVIAATVSLLYLINPLLFAMTARHFMTEPLHVVLMLAIVFGLLAYFRTGRSWRLFLVAGLIGLDYLARPNGLFVMASLFVALGLAEVASLVTARRRPDGAWFAEKLMLYGGALLVFVIVTTPSWVPREVAFGNPIYHGYLSNYMWVDTYNQGHVGQVYATYHWQDYVRSHTVGDALRRFVWGAWMVCCDVPRRMESPVSLLIFLALGGVGLAAIRGPAAWRVLGVFGVIQLLPLIWTFQSNPTLRVCYGATFPFEIAFAAFFIAWAADRFPLSKIVRQASRRDWKMAGNADRMP